MDDRDDDYGDDIEDVSELEVLRAYVDAAPWRYADEPESRFEVKAAVRPWEYGPDTEPCPPFWRLMRASLMELGATNPALAVTMSYREDGIAKLEYCIRFGAGRMRAAEKALREAGINRSGILTKDRLLVVSVGIHSVGPQGPGVACVVELVSHDRPLPGILPPDVTI